MTLKGGGEKENEMKIHIKMVCVCGRKIWQKTFAGRILKFERILSFHLEKANSKVDLNDNLNAGWYKSLYLWMK